MSNKSPKTVILVPFSSEDKSRIEIWRHVQNWLKKTLDYPIFVGEHIPKSPILFNISIARNHAAWLAGDWDVAVIHDADTVINPQHIQAGVAVAMETGALIYPYSERYELDFEGTKMLLQNEKSDWQSHMQKYTRNQPLGGCIIVRRDLWDMVRGFDTGFVGWGHEDGAFAMACEVLSGKKLQRVQGNSLHLEHVWASAKNHESPVYLANKERIKNYMESSVKINAIDLIRKFRDQSIKTDLDSGIMWPDTTKETNLMNKAAALMLLVDVTNVLDKYKSTHWLSDGTLLGSIRDNDFISHDNDLDLGVWAADFDVRVIHELINRYGCNILRLQGKPEDGMLITVGRVGIHLDMFFYYPNKKKGIYSSMYFLLKPYNTSNKAKRVNFEYPNYKPLVRRKFLGHDFWVPKNAKQFLVAEYGKDWQTPKSKWTTEKDQCNLKQNGVIADMAAQRRLVEDYLNIHRV